MPEDPPSWFIADSSLSSVGERREQQAAAKAEEAKAAAAREALETLQQIFPDASEQQLREAVEAGGDLSVVVDRLLAATAPDTEADSAGGASSSSSGGDGAGEAQPRGPTRRVRFAVERSDGTMSRLSDGDLSDQMASSGIRSDPVQGSARQSALRSRTAGATADDMTLGGVLQQGTSVGEQSLSTLANGPLRISARVVRTANELEEGLVYGERVVTKFVIEISQLGFKWEVGRRYSEFHRFHELLALQWADLPPLPPKLLFSQECEDIAERMLQLDLYLRALLASPALALSPLVCAFLDAVDVSSFRRQLTLVNAMRPPPPPEQPAVTPLGLEAMEMEMDEPRAAASAQSADD